MGVDLIGSGDKVVAVVEVDRESGKKIEDVVKEIVSHNRNVKSVIEKFSGTKGTFRMREQRLVWGDEDTEVVHKEHGYLIKVDPKLVYFSPRESTVRQHISKQVKAGEKVLVMFAGVGPYAVSIAKSQPEVGEVVAVEVNPDGVRYMKENVRINKISHLVTPIEGDVEDVCKNYTGAFDRIVMPMVTASDFLETAVSCAKSGATIHIYMVSNELELFEDCKNFLRDKFVGYERKFEVGNMQKISLYAPGKWKVLMEIIVK